MGYYSDLDVEMKETNSAEEAAERKEKKVRSGYIIDVKYANVRATPSRTGEVIGQLSKNESFSILGEVGDYYKIEYKNYKKAFIAKHLVAEKIFQ